MKKPAKTIHASPNGRLKVQSTANFWWTQWLLLLLFVWHKPLAMLFPSYGCRCPFQSFCASMDMLPKRKPWPNGQPKCDHGFCGEEGASRLDRTKGDGNHLLVRLPAQPAGLFGKVFPDCREAKPEATQTVRGKLLVFLMGFGPSTAKEAAVQKEEVYGF